MAGESQRGKCFFVSRGVCVAESCQTEYFLIFPTCQGQMDLNTLIRDNITLFHKRTQQLPEAAQVVCIHCLQSRTHKYEQMLCLMSSNA